MNESAICHWHSRFPDLGSRRSKRRCGDRDARGAASVTTLAKEDQMRMLMMTVFAAGLAACAMQPTTESTSTDQLQTTSVSDWHQVTQPIATGDPATGDVSDSAPIEDAINPRAGCSIVQFCNAPGSDGTRCLQQGCSLGAALDEC